MSNTFAVSTGAGATTANGAVAANFFGVTSGVAFSSITAPGSVSGIVSRRWLPDNNVPIADPKTGLPNAAWYRFFDEISANRLGGIDGPTIAQVSSVASSASDTVAAVASVQSAIVQVVNTNAAATIAQTQVLVASDADGSAQIPPVTRVQQ